MNFCPVGYGILRVYLSEELIVITHYENQQNDKRQYIGEIWTCPFWKFNTVSKIRLFDEVVPSPSIAGNAEQQVNKASKGKQVVGDNEVLQVLNGASCAKRLKTAPYIESKHAWHGQNERWRYRLPATAFLRLHPHRSMAKLKIFSNTAMMVERAANVMKDKEQCAPEASAHHLVEHVGQCYEHKSNTLCRTYIVSKACRENNKAGHQRYEGIQNTDLDGFAHKAAFFVDVASEDRHSADSKAQGEECLSHSGIDTGKQSVFFQTAKIRKQIELNAFDCPWKGTALDTEDYHNGKKTNHHNFGDTLNAFLQSHAAGAKAKSSYDYHPEGHFSWIGKQGVKDISDTRLCQDL